ncbi:MAG: glucose-6-phosphate isomerase family protein [Tepidisphaeraceae bacterium]
MTLPRIQFDQLSGPGVTRSGKTIGDLAGVFSDEAAHAAMPASTLAYEVLMHAAVPEGTPGGLFFGISLLSPGDVGGECFMTRGHFHANADRGEYYWGISGTGLLVLMTRDRKWRVEEVSPGSLHYIPGETAHRLVNTGDERLAVGACWPSDAGHDYASIARDGFSVRVYRRDGKVRLVEEGVR